MPPSVSGVRRCGRVTRQHPIYFAACQAKELCVSMQETSYKTTSSPGKTGEFRKLTSRHFDARCKGGDLTPRQRLNMFTGRKEIPLKARRVGLLTEHD